MIIAGGENNFWKGIALKGGSSKLLMGERKHDRTVNATPAKISLDVQSEIEALAGVALSRLEESIVVNFSETTLLEEKEFFHKPLIPAAAPGDESTARTVEEDVEVGSLLQAVADAHRMTTRLDTDDLGTRKFPFYVVSAEDSDGRPIAFVKRPHGFRIGNKGKIFLRYSDSLEKIEDPLFALAYDFDFVIYRDTLAIWNIDSFYAMFTDIEAMQGAVPQFVQDLAEKMPLPISTETIENIKTLGAKGARAAQQIRRLSRDSWISDITQEKMQLALEDVKGVEHTMKFDGTMNVSLEDVPTFLNILEQKIYRGRFDGRTRRSQGERTLN